MGIDDRFGTTRPKETGMDLGSWLIPCALALCTTIAVLVARSASRHRKRDGEATQQRVRRAGGHALLGEGRRDWLPARVPLIPFGQAPGGRVPVPFFRAPAERKTLKNRGRPTLRLPRCSPAIAATC
jgi:hypothetical protein